MERGRPYDLPQTCAAQRQTSVAAPIRPASFPSEACTTLTMLAVPDMACSEIARRIGARPVDVGPLENAGTLERLTAMIIGMNIRLKRRHIGIRFTGL